MNKLLSKQGKSIMELAQMLLSRSPADRLPTMQHIADAQNVSVGTVQTSMQYLQSEGIVQVENRGRLGAFVQQLEYARLWGLAYQRSMIAVLPMPYSRRLEGLATALRQSFDQLDIELTLRFVRGATARIQRLHEGQCDWIVISRYAAETASVHGFEVEILFRMGNGTYTVDHVLLLRDQQILRPGTRVGIDTSSVDHAYVVRQLSRGIPVEFVEIDYSTGIDRLLLGEIDATVWTAPDLPVLPEHVRVLRLKDAMFETSLLQRLGEAVIAGLPSAVPVARVLQTALNIDALRTVQDDVLNGRRRPTY